MLRSLDPKTNFEKPKSRKFMPVGKDELEKFSKGEIESMERAQKRTEELAVNRAVKAKQDSVVRDVVLREMRQSEKEKS